MAVPLPAEQVGEFRAALPDVEVQPVQYQGEVGFPPAQLLGNLIEAILGGVTSQGQIETVATRKFPGDWVRRPLFPAVDVHAFQARSPFPDRRLEHPAEPQSQRGLARPAGPVDQNLLACSTLEEGPEESDELPELLLATDEILGGVIGPKLGHIFEDGSPDALQPPAQIFSPPIGMP